MATLGREGGGFFLKQKQSYDHELLRKIFEHTLRRRLQQRRQKGDLTLE